MLGIIATIIAAKKGHATFAWVVGIWSAIEIILLLAKSPYAVGPGGMFVLIAICMTNLNKPKKESKPTNNPPTGINKLFSTASYETTSSDVNSHLEQVTKDATQIEESNRIAPLLCDVPGYIECPLCHTRQKIGRPRCFGCDVAFTVKPAVAITRPEIENTSENEPTTTEAEMQSDPSAPKVRFCRKCGFQLLDDSDFCSHCGTKVLTVLQRAETKNAPPDTILPVETVEETVIIRDHHFWENLNQYCGVAQEDFKEQMLPLLSKAGILSTTGNAVKVDINNMMKPTYVLAELWLFPIAVLVAALHECLPDITEEDEENIKKYLYSCGNSIIQPIQQIAKDEAKKLSDRMNDYNTACKNEMVCGYSWCGQGKILYHDFDELEISAESKNNESKCAFLFNDILYYINYYGSLPTLADTSKIKAIVMDNAANYARKFEDLYRAVHPYVCALYDEVKRITNV